MGSDNAEVSKSQDAMPKGRSPSYPGISLARAIQRAKILYDHARQHPVPLAKLTSLWGYKAPTTGPASVTYAALKKYGLLEEQGSGNDRVGRLTDLAVEVLIPNPGQQQAIQRAALTPPIHREWWEKYGNDLPPDSTLHWDHVIKGRFTEKGFREFLRVFQETTAFAKLDAEVLNGGDESSDEAVDTAEASEPATGSPAVETHELAVRQDVDRPEALMSYPIPVEAGINVMVQGPFPLTEGQWAQFLAVLSAMKPALTQQEPQPRADHVSPDAVE